eukprot:s872_g13.t2
MAAHHGRHVDEYACTQVYNGESDDEDITAELLQSGRQEQQTELRDATPVPNLPSGASVQQPAMSEGNADSGGLAACMADVSLAAPSAVSDELACTLQYEIRDGIEEVGPPSNAEAPAANRVTTSCAEMRPPRLCNDLACTQAYNGESDDEDITAELLQPGRQGQQTELRDATPVPNLPSGGSVQKRAMSECNGDSGGLAACRADVSAAAKSAISIESACTLHREINEGGFGVGSGHQPPHDVAHAQPLERGCTGVRIERKSVASDCHGEPHHRAPNSSSRYRPRMVSVMVQTGEDDTKEEPRKARPANKPEPPRLSLLIPKRPRDETVEPVDVDAYSAACHALWGGRTPQKVAAPSLRDFLAAKQEEVEENCEPPPGTLALVGLSPRSELSPFDVHGNQADVKKEALSAKRVPKTSLPSPPERSEPRLSEPLPKRSQTQRLGPGGQGQSSEIPERFVKQSTRRSLDFGSLSPKHGDHTVPVPAWLQQIHAVKRGRPTEPECVKGLQAEILPTPCRRGRLNSRCQPSPDLSESESESPATMPPASPPPQQAPIGAPAPASVSTAKEGSPSASAASTAPATPTASPSPRARVVTEQSDAQASQCSEALEPLAAPVETMEVSAPSPGETPENTATAEEASARLSSTECRDDADDADDADGVGTGRSQFCFAKTTQEEERARREANGATGSPQSPSQNVAYASAPAPVDLSQFAFVATATATVHQTAKTTVPEDSAAPKLAPPPCGACAEAEPPTLSGSSSLSVIPVSLSQEPPKEVKRTAAKSRAKSRTKTSVPPHWQRQVQTAWLLHVADARVLRTFNAAVISGVAGGCAQVMYVFPLMWLRTIMEYQYKNGEGTVKVARTLYREGGVARFYRGLMPAMILAPTARFGDTAANELALSSLARVEMPLALKTLCASVTAATFRATVNPLSLWHGGLGVLVTGAFGHYPWFYTNNLLREILPPFEMRYGKHVRHAFIGFTSSVVADTICNPIRVLKVNRQTSLSRYLEAAACLYSDLLTWFLAVVCLTQAHGIIQKEGLLGLWSRGLKTRIFANGVQGSLFTVGWRYFSEVNPHIPQPFHRPVCWTKAGQNRALEDSLKEPLPAELGGPVALTPAGPASAAPSPEAEVKKGKQGRHADSEASASMLEVRRAISDDDSDAPLAKRIRRRATAPARLTPGKAPKAKARAGAAAVPSARPTTAASQANLEGESKAPEQSKKRAAPSRQEPSKKCRKAAASKETAKPKALRALKDTAFANPAEAAVAAANGRPVFATTGLELSSRQQKFLLDLQGLMVAEWNPHVSHLIADTFRRTTKMMCAICTGAHILSTEYVKACREAGRLVDEAAFLLKDEVCEAAFARKRGISQGYSLAAALQRARQNGPLLHGMSVYCFPSVGEKRELPMLVAAAGGTWLKRFPLQPACTSVLLLAERCVSSEREQQRRRVYEVYDVELLREAACTQELRRSAYRLQ